MAALFLVEKRLGLVVVPIARSLKMHPSGRPRGPRRQDRSQTAGIVVFIVLLGISHSRSQVKGNGGRRLSIHLVRASLPKDVIALGEAISARGGRDCHPSGRGTLLLATAGLQGLSRGDLILAVDGTPVRRVEDFRLLMDRIRGRHSTTPVLFLVHSKDLGHTRFLAVEP